MNLPERYRILPPSREPVLGAFLILVAIAGLVTRGFISWNLRLDSDSVGMGILSMEIAKHQNFLLSGCHLSVSDSFVFTELPLQLIPQILTGYSPVALKMVSFSIIILNILALSYLILIVFQSRVPALLFGALAAVIPPGGYFWLAYPTTHNATILFSAAILIILFTLIISVNNQKKTGKPKKPRGAGPVVVPRKYPTVLAVLAFLSVFSDTIILIWVLVPFFIVYPILLRREYREMDTVVIALAAASAAAYGIKTYLVSDWLRIGFTLHSIPDMIALTIPLLFSSLALFLNQGLTSLLEHGAAAGPAAMVSFLLFAGVIAGCAWGVRSGRSGMDGVKGVLVSFLLVSVLVSAVFFVVLGYSSDINSARYLVFPALALLMLVAVSCPLTETICLVPVVLLLIISAAAGGVYAETMDTRPDAREYGLIANLSSQNLDFGYGTYWDSNVVTYLSGEHVVVRSTYIAPDDLLPDQLNSCTRWYGNRPDNFFLIYDGTRPADEAQKHYPELKRLLNSSGTLQYDNFEVLTSHPV